MEHGRPGTGWRSFAGLFIACALGCASSGPELPAAGESIELVFGWDPQTRFTLTETQTVTRRTEVMRSSETIRTTLQIWAERAGDGFIIHLDDPEIESDSPSTEARYRDHLEQQLGSLSPDIRVSRTGAFEDVMDLQGFRRALVEETEEAYRDVPPDTLERILRDYLAPESIRGRERARWNGVVGTWAGRRLRLGVPITKSEQAPIPLYPEESVMMHSTQAARRALPCERQGVARPCVELEIINSADAADTRRLVEDIEARLSEEEKQNGPVVKALTMNTVMRIVTEPEGLYPHTVWLRRVTRTRYLQDDREWHSSRTVESRTVFTYP